MKPELYNGLTLAYIGDAVYELYIRNHMLELNKTKVNELHKSAVKYTEGIAQAYVIRTLKEQNILSEEELEYYKRGRNSSVSKIRKNISRMDYLEGTGFEALIGYLYLTKREERLNYIVSLAIKIIEEGDDYGKEESK